MASTKIEWTDSSWNPITGCTKISPGCNNCYAEKLSKRLKAMGNPNYKNGFGLTLHRDTLLLPLSWKNPKLIFVNSMSDLFHENIPIEFIKDVFGIMTKAYWHTFQILTKRSSRLVEIAHLLPWPRNIWMGVSVENSDYTYRIDDVRRIPANIKFISIEPLLGPIPDLNLQNIDWVIVGGESGPHSRPIEEEWVKEIKNQCLNEKVPFFFKQWGGKNKKKAGRLLEGKIWDEMPLQQSTIQ